MVCLEMNKDHSVVFEIASKYCISDSFVDYDGYSISSKGFLPTVVDIMVIWVKFTHSSPFWRRQRHPTPVLLLGKSHGRRSLVGCSLWGRWVGHDWATSLSLFTFMHWRRKCYPLQCSCLENPRDGGTWWAAVHGVAQSRTGLKRFSSSSSRERQTAGMA